MDRRATDEVFLTNQSCEAVGGSASEFQAMGVGFSEGVDDDFYPLTDGEALLVADDVLVVQGRDVEGSDEAPTYHILMGYSVLQNAEKFLAPCVEHDFIEGNSEDRDRALREVRDFADAVAATLEAAGGTVHVAEDELPWRHQIEIRIPFEYALKNAETYEEWQAHLKNELLAGVANEAANQPRM